MKTIQQQLADKIYELLPHKKELKFGCEVKIIPPSTFEKYPDVFYKNGVYLNPEKSIIEYIAVIQQDYPLGGFATRYDIAFKYKHQNKYIDGDGGKDYIHISLKSKVWDMMISSKKIEIIGQPLHLADLLLAIDKHTDETNNYIYTVWTTGLFADKVKYNLSQDNILNQSDELCKFCLELLN